MKKAPQSLELDHVNFYWFEGEFQIQVRQPGGFTILRDHDLKRLLDFLALNPTGRS